MVSDPGEKVKRKLNLLVKLLWKFKFIAVNNF